MILVKTHLTCILYTEHQSQASATGPMALLCKWIPQFSLSIILKDTHLLSCDIKYTQQGRHLIRLNKNQKNGNAIVHFNPFPNEKILDFQGLKEFADNNFEVDKNGRKLR